MWMITVFLSVVLTLLVEHRMVLAWVVKEDWPALLDVIPGMFSISAAYVLTLFAANACLIGMAREKH